MTVAEVLGEFIPVRTPAGIALLILVTVYLPGSPDPWMGSVVILPAERVEPVAVEFGDAVAVCEQLGRNSKIFLAGKK
jgi:hypothetical protein